MMMENSTLDEPNFGCTLPYDIPGEQWIWYNGYAWWMEGFGSLFVGFIGIFLNITTVGVLLGSFLGASFFNWLLVCLSVFDSLFLLNGILEAFRNHIGIASYQHHYIFVNFLYPFRSVVMFCSMYMTVILALERYNALARPTNHQSSTRGNRRFTVWSYFKMHWLRLLKYVGPVILLSTLFYSPKYMELYLKKDVRCNTTVANFNCSEYMVGLTDLRKSSDYVLWYLNVTNLIVTTVIPLVALAYLNFNVYLKFKQYIHRQPSHRHTTRPTQNQQGHPTTTPTPNNHHHKNNNVQERFRKREKDVIQQTMILFVIVILFVLSHVLRIILNIEEMKSLREEREALDQGCEWLKFWTIIVAPISHLLLQINSSINFFIYCFYNQSFRDVLLHKLGLVFNVSDWKQRWDDNIAPKVVATNGDPTNNANNDEKTIVTKISPVIKFHHNPHQQQQGATMNANMSTANTTEQHVCAQPIEMVNLLETKK